MTIFISILAGCLMSFGMLEEKPECVIFGFILILFIIVGALL